jgi:hypothetical protein
MGAILGQALANLFSKKMTVGLGALLAIGWIAGSGLPPRVAISAIAASALVAAVHIAAQAQVDAARAKCRQPPPADVGGIVYETGCTATVGEDGAANGPSANVEAG